MGGRDGDTQPEENRTDTLEFGAVEPFILQRVGMLDAGVFSDGYHFRTTHLYIPASSKVAAKLVKLLHPNDSAYIEFKGGTWARMNTW